MKKILINGLLLRDDYSGVQYSIEYLVSAFTAADTMGMELEVLVPADYNGPLTASRLIRIKRIKTAIFKRYGRIFFEQFILPRYLRKNGFQLYHSPGYILPLYGKTPKVVTVHDLIALDMPTLCQQSTAVYFKRFLPRSISSATRIITVSNTVKADILRRYPEVCPEKISVIYPGIGLHFTPVTDPATRMAVKDRYGLPDRYLLFVGNIEPKKNLTTVLQAFFHLKEQAGIPHKLVIIGRLAWKYQPVLQLLEQSPYRSSVILTGYINGADLPAIYSMADLLLFPSLYEGFGIPVIEAMACGCPVVVSHTGALPEISGGIASQVPPDNMHQLAAAILALTADQAGRSRATAEGIAWSKRYSWERAAQETCLLYKSICSCQ